MDRANADHKNIRRRVYDALNVLMALKIIAKEKRDIRWLGLPGEPSVDELRMLKDQKTDTEMRIAALEAMQAELTQQVCACC